MGAGNSTGGVHDDNLRERYIPTLLEEYATLPTRPTPECSGFELRSSVAVELKVGTVSAISTGVSFTLPVGLVGHIVPNLELAKDHGVMVQSAYVDAASTESLTVYASKLAGDSVILEQGSVVATVIFSPAVVGVSCVCVSSAEEATAVGVAEDDMDPKKAEKTPLNGGGDHSNGHLKKQDDEVV